MFLMLFGMRALDGGLYIDKVDAKCDPNALPDKAPGEGEDTTDFIGYTKENCIYKK